MFEFKILKKSKQSRARLGIIKTSHGEIETPTLVPVATQAVIKTLTSEEAKLAKCQILICNTFHLHLKPGEKIIKNAGGLHKFMNWSKPLMTDSGGFQVFSLGFGHDLQIGKLLKYFPPERRKQEIIPKGAQPKQVKITDSGVYFRSPVDGKEIFLGPKESIRIQQALGADIIFAFDECTPPLASLQYIKKALERTHFWAKKCLDIKKNGQAMFGIIQGSRFKKLREQSAKFITGLDFEGFGIGGDLGATKLTMQKILNWVLPFLPESKPRHLLGIGHLEDIENIAKSGIDTFDCTVPTHYARHGIAFTSRGKLDLKQSKYLKDQNPLDKTCACLACFQYGRNYIAHLFRSRELTALKLLTFHNLFFFNTFVEKVREKIKKSII